MIQGHKYAEGDEIAGFGLHPSAPTKRSFKESGLENEESSEDNESDLSNAGHLMITSTL